MATSRDLPYSQFNFLVDLGTGDTESVRAGFQEITGLGLEITVAEHRRGNSPQLAPEKITGTHKVPDVTLKRGVIGDLDLYDWLNEVRNGKQDAVRTVTIQLQSEDRATIAQEWKLSRARPIKYTGPSLNGKGTDVAIEELVLACERIELA